MPFEQPRVDQCKMENQQASARVKPLSLVDMSSAFVVLGLGISLAFLVFLLELIYKRIQDHYFTDHEKVKATKTPVKKGNAHKILPIANKVSSAKNLKQKENGIPAAKASADTNNKKVTISVEVHRADSTKQAGAVPPVNQRNRAAIIASFDEILEI